MNSKTKESFRKRFEDLPGDVRLLARQAYRLWRQDPWHNSLRFKQVHQSKPFYSVRIGAHWRAVGVKTGNEMVWFWIGSHAEYDGLLKQL